MQSTGIQPRQTLDDRPTPLPLRVWRISRRTQRHWFLLPGSRPSGSTAAVRLSAIPGVRSWDSLGWDRGLRPWEQCTHNVHTIATPEPLVAIDKTLVDSQIAWSGT